ncbi:hypothetical protein BAE44_0023529 [Dichanthelium oligosanthes]|uniref:Uncharacterized protein n=1 Tax=Dichanthelium oligosanthes TaxID=888268 RepID=A0A1E5URG5_9POAL|nr:hypothetical protein BAE44_0023529 [Dichanthelium oligosanthes]
MASMGVAVKMDVDRKRNNFVEAGEVARALRSSRERDPLPLRSQRQRTSDGHRTARCNGTGKTAQVRYRLARTVRPTERTVRERARGGGGSRRRRRDSQRSSAVVSSR